MTGSTGIACLSGGDPTRQSFGKLQGRQPFPDPTWAIQEIGMAEAGTYQGFLKQ
jgi:hypothetical protein